MRNKKKKKVKENGENRIFRVRRAERNSHGHVASIDFEGHVHQCVYTRFHAADAFGHGSTVSSLDFAACKNSVVVAVSTPGIFIPLQPPSTLVAAYGWNKNY